MRGPWARHAFVAIAGDAHGEATVDDLRVEPGAIFARVGECEVSVLAPLVPHGVWDAVVRFARNRAALRAGVEARAQSEQLEHLMAEDWEEPLVPPADAIARACTCDDDGDCEHVAAAASAVADAIDADPGTLLVWRGCVDEVPPPGDDAWRGGPLPELAPPRPRPAGAVLMRLGESGIKTPAGDLADALRPAYDAFADEAQSGL